ncbi:hypothetical protein BGZ90_005018 [Linnemannia elongata]|nr:hypothetical protein BGZ90_005018 [Linnemannia elongata]
MSKTDAPHHPSFHQLEDLVASLGPSLSPPDLLIDIQTLDLARADAVRDEAELMAAQAVGRMFDDTFVESVGGPCIPSIFEGALTWTSWMEIPCPVGTGLDDSPTLWLFAGQTPSHRSLSLNLFLQSATPRWDLNQVSIWLPTLQIYETRNPILETNRPQIRHLTTSTTSK